MVVIEEKLVAIRKKGRVAASRDDNIYIKYFTTPYPSKI